MSQALSPRLGEKYAFTATILHKSQEIDGMENTRSYVWEDISSTMFFSSFHASVTYLSIHQVVSTALPNAGTVTHFVWLPLATISSLPFRNLILVYAKFFPNLSQVTSARSVSPILPPELMYVTLRSVETPVAKSPLEATANEPPRSTSTSRGQLGIVGRYREGDLPMLAMVPPWRIPRRFLHETYQ